MQNVYKNNEGFSPSRKCNVLFVFDHMIADMIINKKRNPLATELFIIGTKLNISTVFIPQYYFKIPKDVRLNCTHILL